MSNNGGPIFNRNIVSPSDQGHCGYQGDEFRHTSNITMSDNPKNNCPSKNSPLSPNIGSFVSAPQAHPAGLPIHAYPPHWNPGPGYVPNNMPYGQPPNFMPPPFPNDPNLYRHHMNNPHPASPNNIPSRNSPQLPLLPHHVNGSTPPPSNSNFTSASEVVSKFHPLPPGCSSPPPPNPHAPTPWSLPSSETQSNNSGGPNFSTRDNFDQLPTSNRSGDNCLIPSSTVSPSGGNKAYIGGTFPNAGEEHSEGRHTLSRGSIPSSSYQSSPTLCAGCKLRIMDKFVLAMDKVEDAKWHSTCLKCVECGVVLENQMSCYERDHQFFCKEDYVR